MIASLLGFFWLIERHGSSIEDKIAFLATIWIPVSGKPPCTGAPGSRSETQQESKLFRPCRRSQLFHLFRAFSLSVLLFAVKRLTQFLPYIYIYIHIICIHIHMYIIYVLSKYVLKVIQGGLGPLQLPLCSWLGASCGPVAS